jgi:hypothetical protein
VESTSIRAHRELDSNEMDVSDFHLHHFNGGFLVPILPTQKLSAPIRGIWRIRSHLGLTGGQLTRVEAMLLPFLPLWRSNCQQDLRAKVPHRGLRDKCRGDRHFQPPSG